MTKLKPYFEKKQFLLLIAVFVLVFDLVSKAVTDGVFHQEAIPGIFCIESYHNTGASFSIFAGSSVAQIIFTILGILICLVMIFYTFFVQNKNKNGWYFVGISLLFAGILGNVIDRLCFGYVRDFISLQFMKFAVFNVADSALCVGAIVFAVWIIFFSFKNTKEKKAE